MIEFAQEVLPEYYRGRKSIVSRNSSMDIRMFEDLYDRFRNLFYDEKRELACIKSKIEELSQIVNVETKVDTLSKERGTTDENSCQNQIRELFHALEAPIATTEMALSNLQASISEIREDQLRKIDKIQNNLKLIKTVLYAYRELTFMTIRSSDNAFLPLPIIIRSVRDFLGFGSEMRVSVNNFPNEIPYYSTNLITILILPLLQNAMEATPKDKIIDVNYIDTIDYHKINILNYCSRLPSLEDLQTDGYSSKGNNHIGTGISIVRRVSNIVGINFVLSVDNSQVIGKRQITRWELKQRRLSTARFPAFVWEFL